MAFLEQSSARSLTSPAAALARVPVQSRRGAASPGFPVMTPDIAATTTHESHAATAAAATMTVYLVADEDDERKALMQGLTRDGFRVSAFADAASFYRTFIATRCDMAVIDLMLHGAGALAIAENLRTHAGTGIVVPAPGGSDGYGLR